MKQSVPPAAIVAVLIVVVAIIGFFVWRTLQPNPNIQNSSAGDAIRASMAGKNPAGAARTPH